MNEHLQPNPLHRKTDFADMPRMLAWALIAVREVGIQGVMIGALLWMVNNHEKQLIDETREFRQLVTQMVVSLQKISDEDGTMISNQREIMRRLQIQWENDGRHRQ